MSARLLVPLAGVAPEPLRIAGDPFHHLRVLRLAPGDTLEVFDGRGRAWDAELLSVEHDHALLRLGATRTVAAGRPISIVQALPKSDKLELVLQKSTELGAHAFHPVVSDRSVVRLSESTVQTRRDRWQRIADEAARQCGRHDVPRVHGVLPLLEAVRALEPGTRVLVLDEGERNLSLSAAADAVPGAALALVIGPEGGLSRTEVEALRALGAVPVSLGPLILRTETAALAALAVLRHRDGFLG